MPTVTTMMILGMRSRDVLLREAPVLPCRLRPKGGEQWGPSSGPSAKTYHRGWGKQTRLLLTPLTDLSLLLFMDLLMERR